MKLGIILGSEQALDDIAEPSPADLELESVARLVTELAEAKVVITSLNPNRSPDRGQTPAHL